MEFIDDEVESSEDDDQVLVPSSQNRTSSDRPRPSKRRRLHRAEAAGSDDSNSDHYDLPSNDGDVDEDLDNPKSKYDALMYVPAYAESQHNEFVTQVEQPWSSPTAIRGPRWRKKSATPPSSPDSPIRPVQNRSSLPSLPRSIARPVAPNPVIVDEFDDEDPDLIEALMASTTDKEPLAMQSQPQSRRQLPKSMRQTTLFGISTTQKETPAATQSRTHSWPMASRNEPPTHHKIDEAAMRTWIYPLNVGTIRDYQFNIVYRALFHNILVALPTGLGKTFIAATVMLNYFNWTKDAQIVFVAPTKPLVTQQVDACFHIAGIPRSNTTLLTGEIQPAIRAEEWQDKRVFFMTPQTLINDLKTGMADPKKIVLLVVDEAHKATGNYAYVEVVRFLRRFNSSFRVLALTATPGATVEAVQKVVDGLDIARVEIRTEESMDIRNFVHTRNEQVELFDNSEEIEMCLDLFATAVKPVLSKVNSLNAYFSNDPKTMTLYGLMKGREQWTKSDAGRKADWGLKGMVQSCFKPLMSLAHNLELLKYHGIGPFYRKMKVFDDEAYGSGKYAKQIVETESYKTMMNRLRGWVNEENFVGHPKLSYLNEVVLNHFMDAGSGVGAAGGRPPSDTRIMVFAHYRDSAEEIVRVLNKHQPMIRAHVFVGQSGTKGSEGMDQKTQIDIIKKFKAGTYNTLVATSIGEEGLDIGEVDLIVCYDCSKSPIRMLQRMGRTGRKRAGNIVLLLMRGKEERDYHAAKDNYLKMQGIIESGKDFQFHEDLSPRIVPRDIQPVVDKRHVDIPFENTQAGALEPRKRKGKPAKRPPKRFNMPDNVETGFQFLGNNKSKKKTIKTPKPVSLSHIDQVQADLPILQDVLLSQKEMEDLEHRYAQVAGDQPQYVEGVRLSAFPSTLRRIGLTRLVKHSSTTKALVQASKTMHATGRNWDRPALTVVSVSKSSMLTASPVHHEPHQRSGHKVGGDIAHNRPSPSDSTNIQSRHGPRKTLSSQPNDGEISLDDDESSVLDKPFYLSQQLAQSSGSDTEDLLAVDDMLSKPRTDGSASTARSTGRSVGRKDVASQRGRKQRAKRILSDESDE